MLFRIFINQWYHPREPAVVLQPPQAYILQNVRKCAKSRVLSPSWRLGRRVPVNQTADTHPCPSSKERFQEIPIITRPISEDVPQPTYYAGLDSSEQSH